MMVLFADISWLQWINSKFLVQYLIWSSGGLLFPYWISFIVW